MFYFLTNEEVIFIGDRPQNQNNKKNKLTMFFMS